MKFKISLLVLSILSGIAFAAHVSDRAIYATDIKNAAGDTVFKFHPTDEPTASTICGYNSNGEAVTANSIGTSTTVLHGNASGDLTFGPVDLSADVTDNLPPANLNNGTNAGVTTFWRGDGTWATPSDSPAPTAEIDVATSSVPSATPTSVLYVDSGNFLNEDAGDFSWDSTENKLTLGASKLTLEGSNVTLPSGTVVGSGISHNTLNSAIAMFTIGSTSATRTGYAIVETGKNTSTGGTGGILIRTGNSTALDSGDIILTTGTAGTTRGSIYAQTRNFVVQGANSVIFDHLNAGLLHSDSDGVVTSSAVDLASSDVTGVLPAANGGAVTPFYEIAGIGLSVTSGANALTIAIKDAASSNADNCADSDCPVTFQTDPSATAYFTSTKITGAKSITISSGSTLGHASGITRNIYVYYTDDGKVAVSSALYPEDALVSTTAEGGAGAADSNYVIYTTTTSTNVRIRLIGILSSNQVTAGTWALSANAELAVQATSDPIAIRASYSTATAGSYVDGLANRTIVDFGTKIHDNVNAVTTGASWKFTANTPGLYNVSGLVTIDTAAGWELNEEADIYLHKNGSGTATRIIGVYLYTAAAGGSTYTVIPFNGDIELAAGDYIDVRLGHTNDGTLSLYTSAAQNWISIKRIGR